MVHIKASVLFTSIFVFSFSTKVFAKSFAPVPYQGIDLTDVLHDGQMPSDDPDDYTIDSTISYVPTITQMSWVSPSNGLPANFNPNHSNNNLSIAFFNGRIFIALRDATSHFAGTDSRITVLSSSNGTDWQFEYQIAPGFDVREPRLISMAGKFTLTYFTAGTDPVSFSPVSIQISHMRAEGDWSDPQPIQAPTEIFWDMKTRHGITYTSSYRGPHYTLSDNAQIEVFFKQAVGDYNSSMPFVSADSPNGVEKAVYTGGISETAWEFDHNGNMWVVARNEDGDSNGFGAQVFYAEKGNLSTWTQVGPLDNQIYESSKLFRHGDNFYLVARKNLASVPFNFAGSFWGMALRRIINWVTYSVTPKGTALYQLNTTDGSLQEVMDLPGDGDTSYPSILQLSAHEFLIANYTSPLNKPHRSWFAGQEGNTSIYMLRLRFDPADSAKAPALSMK